MLKETKIANSKWYCVLIVFILSIENHWVLLRTSWFQGENHGFRWSLEFALHTQFLDGWSEPLSHLPGVKGTHCQGYLMAPFLQRRGIFTVSYYFYWGLSNGEHVFKSMIFEAQYIWICFHFLVILRKLLKFHKHQFLF